MTEATSATLQPKPAAKAGADKNGVASRRRTYQHGLPIATVVTKLLGMSVAKRSITVGQVQQMLEQEYKKLGLGTRPPHARNLEGIASGILDVVGRDPRQLRTPRQNDSEASGEAQ